MSTKTFAALLQGFFADRLLRQMRVSTNTIASYRDAFRLLLRYAAEHLGKAPSSLAIEDLDPDLLVGFLDHLESSRGNRTATRNSRLAAMRSFFRHVAVNEPAYALHCQRVLALPQKRCQRRIIDFLQQNEIEALLAAPDVSTWIGRRDRTILLLAVQTGFRVSELTSLRAESVSIGTKSHVRCVGKGRKHRSVPLRRDTIKALDAWMSETRPAPGDPLFPSSRGSPLSSDAVQRLVAKHASAAAEYCPSLRDKRVTPHVLRHSVAMALRDQGVDLSVVALWLGHESVETTQMYLHADTKMKERALALTNAIDGEPGRFEPDDELMAFLEGM